MAYFVRLDARYNNLILIFQETINDFNEFLKLPPKSNDMMRYWDFAWAALNTVLPMLRIHPSWVQLEQTAQAELRAANFALQNTELRTKLMTYAARGHNVADWMAKENTMAARMRDLPPPARGKSDRSRTPIKALMAESDLAHQALEKVIESTWEEYKVRMTYILTGQAFAPKESIEQMVDRKLPKLNYMTADETEHVSQSYMWAIFKSWAPQNVAIVTTRFRTGDTISIDGLNDTQQDKIMEWFGPTSYLQGSLVPIFPTIYFILNYWAVPYTKKSSGGSTFGFG